MKFIDIFKEKTQKIVIYKNELFLERQQTPKEYSDRPQILYAGY